jgi:Mn2+/Fe2+ NRAMP family transporter
MRYNKPKKSGVMKKDKDIVNPYVRHPAYIREPPVTLKDTLKFLGPGLILVGSVVGSGEIILTTTLGATVGFVMLWWMLLSCWGKSIVQAELGRYTVSSGETFLSAFDRLPGKLPGSKRQVSWFIWLWLFTLIPGHLGGGGIYGGSGQAIHMALPFLASKWWTIILAALASILILSGTYRFLEKLMTFMVATFTLITLTCAVLLQFTEYAITWADVKAGLRFEFPAFAVAAALAAYGGTGVTAGESMAYTYWCVEKGYARFAGPTDRSSDWVRRAKGWIRVMHFDVALTLIILTSATVPFYMLGAGVLNRMGVKPDGLETISLLSNMYTQTLGKWAWWLFMLAAFFILYSTVISGLGGGARTFADCMIAFGVIKPDDYRARLRVIRIWAVISPAITALCYFFIENPIWMLTIGGTVSAMMTPIVAGGTIYLRYTHLDKRIAPSWKSDLILWVCFLIMLGLGIYAVYLQFA